MRKVFFNAVENKSVDPQLWMGSGLALSYSF